MTPTAAMEPMSSAKNPTSEPTRSGTKSVRSSRDPQHAMTASVFVVPVRSASASSALSSAVDDVSSSSSRIVGATSGSATPSCIVDVTSGSSTSAAAGLISAAAPLGRSRDRQVAARSS